MKIKSNTTLLLTTAICLIPVIFALLVFEKLPALIPTHFDNAGNPDSYMPKAMAAFGLPLLLAVLNIYTQFRLNNDPKVQNASSAIRQVMRWVVPIISIIFVPFSLVTAMGTKLPIVMVATALVGIGIIICGNYLPKCRQNYTVGIKLPWTLNNEVVWNKTHRFAGFVWAIGGLIILVNAFVSIPFILLVVIALLVILPFIYSYLEYKKEESNTPGI